MGGYGDLVSVLQGHKHEMGPVLPFNQQTWNYIVFDLSSRDTELFRIIQMQGLQGAAEHVEKRLRNAGADFGVGKYNEERYLYTTDLFINRSVHIGMDLIVPSGTPISAPLPARVHSFKNNCEKAGDYGPTIILQHDLDGITFYTLYGHLKLDSLSSMEKGKDVDAGERIGWVGTPAENGGYPPHLHFQLLTTMKKLNQDTEMEGDYPGVVSFDEREAYLALCPDPNLVLRIPGLDADATRTSPMQE